MATEATQFLAEIMTRTAKPRWISFLGPSGTGKTMLAKMIFRFIHQHCLLFSPGYGFTLTENCYSARWPTMVKEMKEGDFGTVNLLCEKEQKWDGREAVTFAYALIDDIGQTEDKQKSYVLSSLGHIADERLGSWTIWTANMGLEQIGDTLDKRISSRMLRGNNVVVELPPETPDWNLR